MDDPDYFTTAIGDLGEELDRLSARGAPRFELAAALSRCEMVLMRIAEPKHHKWLCERFQALAEQHDLVAHCIEQGSKTVSA